MLSTIFLASSAPIWFSFVEFSFVESLFDLSMSIFPFLPFSVSLSLFYKKYILQMALSDIKLHIQIYITIFSIRSAHLMVTSGISRAFQEADSSC